MAALRTADITVRAALPGEGRAVASLWRELWDAHEAWGGYAGSHDERIYAQLAVRLEEDARVRGGQPVLGRHIHLVAAAQGKVSGQVEGWFERHGVDDATPFTCEVRSLIVRQTTRTSGLGRALLETLAGTARRLGRGGAVILAAEVLEPNPAHSFYAKVGYVPVSWSARIHTALGAASPIGGVAKGARVADASDALAVALLDGTLAARRRAAGDLRFDRPRAVDATLVGAIAGHLGRAAAGGVDPMELVAVDERGDVRASASLAIALLDPPFLPVKRAILGRFAVDPACKAAPYVAPLIALGSRLAALRGAPTMELTDLSAPGSELHSAALATGARPWSRLVSRMIA